MKNLNIIILLGTLFFSNLLLAQNIDKIFYGEKLVIHSEIIGAEKEYWIHLPIDYKTTQKQYPVMYITDGDEHFFLASGVTEFMSSQYIIPEFIIVAIFHKDRNHDLTPTHSLTDCFGSENNAAKVSGGGEKLLQFIEKELAPQIEKNYRVASFKILVGHSLGGLFSIYAYLTGSNSFNAFIAMDPALTWDDYFCEQLLKNLPDDAPNFKNKLYMSSAHNAPDNEEDTSPFRLSQNSFFKELESKNVKNAKHEYFEKENHLTVPYKSLYSGLSYIFEDYYIFNNNNFTEEASFFKEHFNNISKLYGIKFTPPEGLVEMLGNHFLFDMNNYDKAKEFFNLNILNYPSSSKAFENLANTFNTSGDKEQALFNYKKALNLNPENKELQQIVKSFQEKEEKK